ncbi:unnamed protein product [Rotaria sp. Silwood2]|nr:unnamed protein product [Rotaria sp. Silwood2]CAF4540885.1 unnamed protein product [Rotaria sp. Silwood2]
MASQLNDLPNEILMIIFKNLNHYDVLYSFIGLNKRFDTIINDTIVQKKLTLITSNGSSDRFTTTIFDRFCREILPKINDKIKWLNIESLTMERILHSTNYHNLDALGLYDLDLETANQLFRDGSYLIRQFQNQILSLVIKVKPRVPQIYSSEESEDKKKEDLKILQFVFTQSCIMFKNLRYLNFSSIDDHQQLTFDLTTSTTFSSNLLELHVAVHSMDDCHYLLDGHFNQLSKFYVTICDVLNDSALAKHKVKKRLNLKCFSLTYKFGLCGYTDGDLIPMLRRMPNLEELSLYFASTHGPIIDGDNLKKNFINHMTGLKKFIFDIRSTIPCYNQVNLPSNEHIQNTLKNVINNQIFSYVDYFSKAHEFRCHIYSYPHTWNFFDNITNNFPGGLFKYVREISLLDERPFQHEFFLRIAHSFPFINKLTLNNREPQENDNQQCLIIKYHHLTILDLVKAHENYVEEFLDSTKTYLLNNVHLYVRYGSLQKATDDFTRDVTQVNCSKIIRLVVFGHNIELPKLKDYFPHANIS